MHAPNMRRKIVAQSGTSNGTCEAEAEENKEGEKKRREVKERAKW